MTPNRPYLIRALHAWITDNGLTPHLLVNAKAAQVTVPTQYVHDGRIVLNVGPTAVRDLYLGNDEIRFSARFGGTPMVVSFPPRAVLAIYARENGEGMAFPEESGPEPEPVPPAPSPEDRRAKLKVVK